MSHVAADVRSGKLTLIIPVGRGSPFVHVAFRVFSLAEDFATNELILNVPRLQLAEDRQVAIFTLRLLVLDDLLDGIFADSPSWKLFELFTHVANISEVLHSLGPLSLDSFGLHFRGFRKDSRRGHRHLSLTLPSLDVLDIEHLGVLLVVDLHLVGFVKLAIRANLCTVLFRLENVL